MAVALPIDHNVAKELWLNGFSVNAISKKLGVKPTTLCAWRKRERWDCQPRIVHKSEASGVQAVAERLASQTLRIIETTLCKLENSPPSSIKDCKEVATAVAAAYATGRKALGLDDTASGTGRVNVTVYSGQVLVETGGQTTLHASQSNEAQKTIDVSSTSTSGASEASQDHIPSSIPEGTETDAQPGAGGTA